MLLETSKISNGMEVFKFSILISCIDLVCCCPSFVVLLIDSLGCDIKADVIWVIHENTRTHDFKRFSKLFNFIWVLCKIFLKPWKGQLTDWWPYFYHTAQSMALTTLHAFKIWFNVKCWKWDYALSVHNFKMFKIWTKICSQLFSIPNPIWCGGLET